MSRGFENVLKVSTVVRQRANATLKSFSKKNAFDAKKRWTDKTIKTYLKRSGRFIFIYSRTKKKVFVISDRN